WLAGVLCRSPPPSLSSLRLLVSPLRLLTAAMWQVAQQQSVKHYGMLEDFVSLVTEAVPQLLTDQQRKLLLLALRAKVFFITHHPHLCLFVHTDAVFMARVPRLQNLLCAGLFQEVFDHSYDSALQSLVSDFLSRIEQMFPVPDFRQAASWLDATPGGLDDCLQEAGLEDLRELLTNQSCSLGRATTSGIRAQKLDKKKIVTLTDEVEEPVNGQNESQTEQESSNESSVAVTEKCSVSLVMVEVIRHLRTNKSCGSALTMTGAVNLQTQPDHDQEPCPPKPSVPEPRAIRTHSCFQCNAVFRTKAELLSHQRSHRARPVYQCGQCDKEFHHLSSLTNHKQTHLDRGGFTCSRCDKVFESAKERDAHRLQHRLPNLTCTVCEQTFSVTQLRIHQRTHTFRSYQCDQCNKTYGSLTGLHSHRASHSAESRFLCPQCGKRFKTRDGLEGHLRTHTGERPYRCPYCPKDFTALAGLNVHVRRHTGERPYVCTVCGKGWPSGGDLQKHMRTHTGERPYVCQDCGKAFSISCHLTEHRRIHTGKRPFSCPECGKCLRRKFDLKKHILSHSNVRPYACVYCPKSYTRKTHLTRHLLTHRGTDDQFQHLQ
uniref:C2H2-type domain-containing protein n=1 Tax=Echeneis naucrates TaxID=173247 RepID=A0A665TLJ0_ECHNA